MSSEKKFMLFCVVLISLFAVDTSVAGFLDNLKRQAEKVVQDTAEDVLNNATGKKKERPVQNSRPPARSSAKPTPPPTAKAGAAALPAYKGAPSYDRRRAALLKVRFWPERYSVGFRRGYYVKEAANEVYGSGYAERSGLEIEQLEKRLKAEAARLPMQFRAINTKIILGTYEERQRYLSIEGNLHSGVILDRVDYVLSIRNIGKSDAEALRRRCAIPREPAFFKTVVA